MARAALILNPRAGGGAAEAVRERVQAWPWLEVLATEEPGEAASLAARAAREGAQLVIAGGGDGTISEVINGLAAQLRSVCLGVLPLGTANDFAKSIQVPLDPVEALAVIAGRGAMRVDLMRAAGRRLLVNAVTGGLSAIAADRMDATLKQRWGRLAYLRAAVDVLADAPRFRLDVQIDDEKLALQSPALAVANGRYAGGLRIAPDAAPDDRCLDIAFVTARSLGEHARLAGRALLGLQDDSPHLLLRRGRRIVIASDPPMGLRGDGEELGETPIELCLHDEPIWVRVPAAQAEVIVDEPWACPG